MQETSWVRKTLLSSVAAFALGGLTVGTAAVAALATQDAQQSEASRPQEARPHQVAPNAALFQQLSFADLVEEVSPAVVSIRTEADVPVRRGRMLPPGFEQMLPPGFRFDYDGGDEDEEGEEFSRRAVGEGSGFFIDDDGHIVTNNHVIEGADAIKVVLDNGDELEATLVGTDPSTDIAVLKVEPSGEQKFVRFAEETDLRVGDYVLAVGNPFGLGGSVTSGIVSALGRENRGNTPYADFIQIDASINRGNSGGPTFDLRGNVVGVNTAIVSPTGGNVGIGLAVPSDVASNVVRQLIAEGAVTRGWLGVQIRDLDDRLASAVGLEETKGALVAAVTEGSPAEKAGFQEGDVVLQFDGTDIDSSTALTRTVGALPPGKTVEARVFREQKERMLKVTLAKRDPYEARQADAADKLDEPKEDQELEMDMGVTFSALTDVFRSRYSLESDLQGVVVAHVKPGSEAEDAGIVEGMVISRADNSPVTSVKDMKKIIEAAQKRKDAEAILIKVTIPARGATILALPITQEDRG